MNPWNTLPAAALFGALSLSLGAAGSASGQAASSATDPVGFTAFTLPANTDTDLAIPLTRPAVFTGTVKSISGNKFTVVASPNWTTNQFTYAAGTQANTYYVIVGPHYAALTGTISVPSGSKTVTGSGTSFKSQLAPGDELMVGSYPATVAAITSDTSLLLSEGFIGSSASAATINYDHNPKEGCYYTVTSNGSNTLTVDLNGDTLSSIASNIGDMTLSVVPYWTLGTAFPASDANVSFVPSPSKTTFETKITVPFATGAGTAVASGTEYFFYDGHWHLTDGSSTVSHDDDVLPPTTSLTVHNAATATKFTPAGTVYTNRITTTLDTSKSGPVDNAVCLPRPSDTKLNDLGLIVSGAFTPGTSTTSKGDLLTTAAGTTYYYYNKAWRLSGGDSTKDVGATVLPYGEALTITKEATTNGATAFWQNTRNF